MRTQPLVDLALYNPFFIRDAFVDTITDKQAWVTDRDVVLAGSYSLMASFEVDFWLLDGSISLVPDDTTDLHVGWVSSSLSNGSGNFAVAPVVNIQFGDENDLTGLTLQFATGEWPTAIEAKFYNNSMTLIETRNYTPTSAEFVDTAARTGTHYIKLTFASTNKANRHLRVRKIDFGKVLHFTGEDIKEAHVLEEIDLLSLTLPIGTADVTLHTDQADFNIVDPAGDYTMLEQGQPLDVYEMVGYDRVLIGEFFLDTWKSLSSKEIAFHAIDLLGLLDAIPFDGWNFNGDIGDTVNGALTWMIETFPYTIDAGLGAEDVWGLIPQCTLREAVQYILNSVNATAICARSSYINIKRVGLPVSNPDGVQLSTWDYALTIADKGAEQELTLKPLVTGADITGWESWELASPPVTTTLYKGSRSPGDYVIHFDTPVYVLGITGGTSMAETPMLMTYNVAVLGTVTITGQLSLIRKHLFSVDASGIDPSAPVNRKSVENNSMIFGLPGFTISGDKVASRMLAYYSMRYEQTMKAFAPRYRVGQSLLIDTQKGRQLWMVVEKMDLDLAGGFVANIRAVGIVKPL